MPAGGALDKGGGLIRWMRNVAGLGLAIFIVSIAHALAQSDPLPSWNDGAAKKAITDFVGRVTMQGGADFVPPEMRIATFDNDGTLWCEQPFYFQLAFAFDDGEEDGHAGDVHWAGAAGAVGATTVS